MYAYKLYAYKKRVYSVKITKPFPERIQYTTLFALNVV